MAPKAKASPAKKSGKVEKTKKEKDPNAPKVLQPPGKPGRRPLGCPWRPRAGAPGVRCCAQRPGLRPRAPPGPAPPWIGAVIACAALPG
jgi:hypothetical protein